MQWIFVKEDSIMVRGSFFRRCFLIFLLMCMSFIYPAVGKAEQKDWIRVGLERSLSERSQLTIQTNYITLGYCIYGNFEKETTLTGSKGFVVKPATGYYYIGKKEYRTYKSAKKMADKLRRLGVSAYPAVTYQSSWNIYVGGSTKKETVKKQYKKIKGKYNLSFGKLQSDNKKRITILTDEGKIVIDTDKHNAYPQIASNSDNRQGVNLIVVENCSYRGRLEVGRYNKNTLTTVNILPVEDYLKGVVPNEMSSAYPIEALKAQAVCARSFCYSRKESVVDSNANQAFVVCDTSHCQVYGGFSTETNQTTAAVNATKGYKLWYQGKIIEANYFSTSGGATENAENVWGSKVPYLKSVPDNYESEPEKEPWSFNFTTKQIQNLFKNRGIDLGKIKDIFAQRYSDSGRVMELKIIGENGTKVWKREEGRSFFSLPGNKYKIVKTKEKPDKVYILSGKKKRQKRIQNSYVISGNGKVSKMSRSVEQYIVKSKDNMTNFARKAPKNNQTIKIVGMGFGHGVGMSQSGAKGMAKEGYSYKDILNYYFKEIKIQS